MVYLDDMTRRIIFVILKYIIYLKESPNILTFRTIFIGLLLQPFGIRLGKRVLHGTTAMDKPVRGGGGIYDVCITVGIRQRKLG